jgi:hypothetical protein
LTTQGVERELLAQLTFRRFAGQGSRDDVGEHGFGSLNRASLPLH